jgi:oligopeptide/dipeptide ABC transporter ATP-binding protein
MLLITHDISLVFESCESMTVMHSGQVAETGSVERLYDSPRHPYLMLLQEAFPDIRYPDSTLAVIDGNPPQVTDDVDYCTFVDRCPWAVEECSKEEPPLESVRDPTGNGDGSNQMAACFRKNEVHELYEEHGKQDVTANE